MTEERRKFLKKNLKKLIQTEAQLLSALACDEHRVVKELGVTHQIIMNELLKVVTLIVEIRDQLENDNDSE